MVAPLFLRHPVGGTGDHDYLMMTSRSSITTSSDRSSKQIKSKLVIQNVLAVTLTCYSTLLLYYYYYYYYLDTRPVRLDNWADKQLLLHLQRLRQSSLPFLRLVIIHLQRCVCRHRLSQRTLLSAGGAINQSTTSHYRRHEVDRGAWQSGARRRRHHVWHRSCH